MQKQLLKDGEDVLEEILVHADTEEKLPVREKEDIETFEEVDYVERRWGGDIHQKIIENFSGNGHLLKYNICGWLICASCYGVANGGTKFPHCIENANSGILNKSKLGIGRKEEMVYY